MLKRKSKDQAEAQEITVRHEKGKMIFAIGGQEFYMTEAVAGSIFGRSVGIQFERLRGQGDDVGELRTLENYVRVQRLLRKGLGMDKVAKALGVPEDRVRAFYGKERAKPHVESWGPNELEIERQRQSDLEMDFVKEIPRPQALSDQELPAPGEKFVDLLQLRNLQRQGKSDERIADDLHLDKKEFSKFMDLNRRYLDLLQ